MDRASPNAPNDVFALAGITASELDPVLVERVRLLFARTETVADCATALQLAERVFEYCAATGAPFSKLEKDTVRFGTLFSDIGKTGPLDASHEQQQLIADMFAVERVPSGQISVTEFFQTYFSAEADARIRRFESLGLDPDMRMREFWNLHVGWTLELLRDRAPFPELIPAAASHHLLEKVNPDSIVAQDGTFTESFGDNTDFDRAEKLIVVLDKYDAARRRSGMDHESAVKWLRQLIARNPRFADDVEFTELLDVVERVAGVD